MKTYTGDMAPYFLQLLERRGEELSAIMRASRETADKHAQAGHGEVTDYKDAALEQSQAVVEDEQVERALHELEQVSTARKRLAARSFGYCLDCGSAINLRRLETVPFTPFCTCCQSARERTAKSAIGY